MDPEVNELSGGEIPLAFRMLENLPGIAASFGFAQNRATNTLLRGGFQDNRRTFGFGDKTFNVRGREFNIKGRQFGGPGKLGGFTQSGELVQPRSSAYYGTRARRSRLAAAAGTPEAKMAIGKGARVNHLTARPRALSRYNSLTMFNAAENSAFYSPFQMVAKLAGNRAVKNDAFKKAVYGGAGPAEGEQVFQRGMLSMMLAGRRTDIMERKAIGGSSRASAKVARAQEQVRRLSAMNNPGLTAARTFSGGEFGRVLPRSAGAGIVLPAGASLTTASAFDNALAGGQRVGLTGNLMASAGATTASRFVLGYGRGALGMMDAGGLTDDAMRGAQKAVSHIQTAIQKAGIQGPFDEKVLKGSVIKNLGGVGKAAKVAASSKEGAMVLGARAGLMAIPGLNLLATASLVYDLGKMGGELVKSGVNLARDAVKSMKGSIDKPMFGMGYKDNEVAATSRARGVMAIQNSRLNARSMLGSEGGMMAAHFG